MKAKLLLVLFLLTSHYSFSQKEELLKGKVYNQNTPLKGVDIINYNTKEQSTTDAYGNFTIAVKRNDTLIFISKEFELKRLVVNQKTYVNEFLSVNLNLKPEELEEVVITKIPSIKLSNNKAYEQGKIDENTLFKNAAKLNTGVYDGTITNGIDLIRIGGMLLDLIIKDKETPKPKAPDVEFKILAKQNCNEKFYLEKLKLKPEEINLFLQFCDVDPNSKTITQNCNELRMMDFLTTKSIEFQQLNDIKK